MLPPVQTKQPCKGPWEGCTRKFVQAFLPNMPSDVFYQNIVDASPEKHALPADVMSLPLKDALCTASVLYCSSFSKKICKGAILPQPVYFFLDLVTGKWDWQCILPQTIRLLQHIKILSRALLSRERFGSLLTSNCNRSIDIWWSLLLPWECY